MSTRQLLISIICLIILTGCHKQETTLKTISSFSFTDQNEESFGTDELEGNVWIASFIFSNCETVCPSMMYEMARLQEKMNNLQINVQFVSFTVDPNFDTPKVLKQFIQQFSNSEKNWHMLTGYSQETIERFAREQFHTIVQKPKNSNQVIHGTNFYLIDKHGLLINEYNYIDDSYIEEIIKEINRLNRK